MHHRTYCLILQIVLHVQVRLWDVARIRLPTYPGIYLHGSDSNCLCEVQLRAGTGTRVSA